MIVRWLRLMGLVVALLAPVRLYAAEPLMVLAAASLRNALDEAGAEWRSSGRSEPRFVYAASSALARQIEAGAPADVFVSADLQWMDHLEGRRFIRAGTRRNLLGNRLVLIAPRDSGIEVALQAGAPLGRLLGDGRLAIVGVDAVPAGRYTRAALETLDIWTDVKGRLAQAVNVWAARALVARGEAPLGIVYATDAAAEPAVRVVAVFPETTHPPIVYPAAVTSGSTHPDAAAFLTFLETPFAADVFRRHGFVKPAAEG